MGTRSWVLLTLTATELGVGSQVSRWRGGGLSIGTGTCVPATCKAASKKLLFFFLQSPQLLWIGLG